MPGNSLSDSDEAHESDDADSSSSHSIENDNNTRMADMSITDPMSSTRSDPQRPIRSQANHSMGTSTTGSFRPYNNAPRYPYPHPFTPPQMESYNNAPQYPYSPPFVPPHMKEPMVNTPDQSSSAHWTPPTSTSNSNSPPSSSRPEFGTGARHDSSFHRWNMSSNNMRGNTITRSYNDNSLIDTTGKC